MPCERPVIAPITDECCFSCFSEGRLPYGAPIAIVLHEVDEHIEALNNRMENCCHDDPDCHSSFHYGVGHNGRIINWVDPGNTAWSFDPINSDQNCGTCGWSIATQEGAGVDPNIYTINIAISTGVIAIPPGGANRLVGNNYTENQYEAVVRLVGWLAETYGITINQNTIWRHCDELDDFPGVCDECFTYSKFLEDVQCCIDTEEYIQCTYTCGCWENAEPTTPGPCDLSAWMGIQSDQDECEWDDCSDPSPVLTNLFFCEEPVRLTAACMPFKRCVTDCNKVGVEVCIDADDPTNTITLGFGAEQTNLMLCYDGVDLTDILEFSPTPTSVDGDFVLNGDEVTSGSPDGSGCVYFDGPVTDVVIIYRSSDPVTEEMCTCLYQLQSSECWCDVPAPLTPGVGVMGCDCKCYTFTDVAAQVEFCALMQGAVPAATEAAVPGVTMLLGRDCDSYYLPELCEQILDLAPVPMPQNFLLLGREGNDCVTTPVNPTCDPVEFSNAVLGLSQDESTIGFYRPRPSLPDREAANGQSLTPATDGVVYLDAENGPVIFTLTPPGPCDPTDYWIKRKDCNDQNTVTVNGGANTIDTLPAIQLGTPGPYGGCGEAVHLHWDGVNWSIL